MPVIFEAADAEFALSTGGNVNRRSGGPGTSRFDMPPGASRALVISSLAGDPDPYGFDTGAVYGLSWAGRDGGGEIAAARVIRSDALAEGGHVVVFEGTDAAGALARVVWTPDFDLRGWLRDVCMTGGEAGFHAVAPCASSAIGAPAACFEADTLIATPRGPVRAASLVPGTLVETLDHGPQMVLWVGQRVVRGEGQGAPVAFPPGALGNARPLVLSQQHRVLLRDPSAADLFGAAEVLVPARALVIAGRAGAVIRERPIIRYVQLLLERHEIVLAEDAPCESLHPGEAARPGPGGEAWQEVIARFPECDGECDGGPDGPVPFETVRRMLRPFEARALFDHASRPGRMAV